MDFESFKEILNDSKDSPKIVEIEDKKSIERYGGNHMLIAPPFEYHEIIAKIPEGKVLTITEIREYLAEKHGADFTCPLTAGIYINMVAHASCKPKNKDVPFWRCLKKDGELHPKYPGGIDYQKEMLEAEGHTFTTKGRDFIRYFVEDYEKKLFEL